MDLSKNSSFATMLTFKIQYFEYDIQKTVFRSKISVKQVGFEFTENQPSHINDLHKE